MTDDLASRLLCVLRAMTDTPTLVFDGPVQPLTGGFWAELVAFRLLDAPDELSGDLVARVMPDAAVARKETALQAETAAQGYPTPTVRLSGGPDAGLGRAFMVMDRAQGGPLLAGLDGVGSITKLPSLLKNIPAVLANAMAELHRLDPAPVQARLDANGETRASVPAMLASAKSAARGYGRDDLALAVDWLVANPPTDSPAVICHGDLHPFNLLVDEDGRVTVLDWSAGLIGAAAYDVAFTSLLLGEPPIAVPRPARPLVRSAGRLLASRFLRDYRDASGATIDDESLRWHQNVVCIRALLEVAAWASAGELDARAGHPWLMCGPAFASKLSTLTGVPVQPR